MRYGMIDLGSNTIRFVAYDISKKQYVQLVNEKEFIGIINFIEKGVLIQEGIDRLTDVLGRMAKLSELLRCKELHCFATASLRNIDNSGEVLAVIAEKTGITVELMSGEQEAECDFLGLTYPKKLEKGIGCDVGGGSAQIFTFQDKQLQFSTSLPIGCLRMYDRFVSGVLMTQEEQNILEAFLSKQFAEVAFIKNAAKKLDTKVLYAMGGTARAGAKLHKNMIGSPNSVEGYHFSVKELDIMNTTLRNMKMNGVHFLNRILPERTHTIMPGLVVLKSIAQCCGAKEIIISKNGVRDGYLIKHTVLDRC